MRTFRLIATLLVASLVTPAFAIGGVNKDMVQLQTQIQQLQDAVARLQQSNDERMGALKDLVQQSADSVNRLSVNMDVLQKQMATQTTAEGTKVDQVSSQMQAMSDSLEEMKTRMSRLEKAVGDIQGQTQSINAALQNVPQNGGTSAGAAAPAQAAPGPQSSLNAPNPPVQSAHDVKPAAGGQHRAARRRSLQGSLQRLHVGQIPGRNG